MQEFYNLKILIIGDPTTGKSTLQSHFARRPDAYWYWGIRNPAKDGIIYNTAVMPFADINLTLQIWDLPESELRTLGFLKGVSGVTLVYDITNRRSFENIEKWKSEILKHYQILPCILIGNKVDLDAERVVSKKEGMDLAEKFMIPFFETSTKTGVNVRECFYYLAQNIMSYYRIISVLKEQKTLISNLDSNTVIKILGMDGFLKNNEIPHFENTFEQKLRRQIIQSLVHSLKNDMHAYVRSSAIDVLSKLVIRDKQVVNSLIQALLNDEHWQVRSCAAYSLSKITGTEIAVKSLGQAMLTDMNEYVRKNVADAIGKIGDERAIPFLVKALDDKKGLVRSQAFESLKTFDYKIPEEKQLLLFLEDDAKFDRILHLVKKNPQTLEDIFLALKNSDVDTRAAKTLGKLGVEMPELLDQILPQLFEALEFEPGLRKKAVWSLGKIAEKEPRRAEQIIFPLIRLLKDERWDVRLETVKIIGVIGVESPEIVENVGAVPILLELLKDEDKRVARLLKDEVQIYVVKALTKWLMSQSRFLINNKGDIQEALELMITTARMIPVQPTNARNIGRYFIPDFLKELDDLFSMLLPEDLSRGFKYKSEKIATKNLRTVAAVKAGLEEITKTLNNIEKILKKKI